MNDKKIWGARIALNNFISTDAEEILNKQTVENIRILLDLAFFYLTAKEKMPKVEDYDLESLPVEKLIQQIIDDCMKAMGL